MAYYTCLVQCYAHEDNSLWCTGRLKLNYTYVHIAQRDSGDKSRNTAVIIGFHYVRRAGAIRYYTVTLYAWMTRAMQAEMEELGFPEWEQGTPCYTPHALLKILPPTTLIMTPCACFTSRHSSPRSLTLYLHPVRSILLHATHKWGMQPSRH